MKYNHPLHEWVINMTRADTGRTAMILCGIDQDEYIREGVNVDESTKGFP